MNTGAPQKEKPRFLGASPAFAAMLDALARIIHSPDCLDQDGQILLLPPIKVKTADTLRKKPLGLYGLAGENTPWTNRNPCTVNCDPGAVPSLTTRPPLGELMSTLLALTGTKGGKWGRCVLRVLREMPAMRSSDLPENTGRRKKGCTEQ